MNIKKGKYWKSNTELKSIGLDSGAQVEYSYPHGMAFWFWATPLVNVGAI